MKKYTLPILLACLSTACFLACTKTPEGQAPKRRSVYSGTCKSTLDSQYVADTVTGTIKRLFIDPVYTDIVDVFADRKNVYFSFRKGTFTERLLNTPIYSFPVDGPYSYISHSDKGPHYKFIFSGKDSLYFNYRDLQASSFFRSKNVQFAARRIE